MSLGKNVKSTTILRQTSKIIHHDEMVRNNRFEDGKEILKVRYFLFDQLSF